MYTALGLGYAGVMANDPDREQDERNQDVVLTSHALDMVVLFDASNVDAEVEADVIRGVLDSSGIPTLVRRPGPYPVLGFQVLVPRGRVVEAQRLLEEARQAGPEAADEAELESESPGQG
jgi:hypothetical protein